MTRRRFPLAALAAALALVAAGCALPELRGAVPRFPALPQTTLVLDDRGRVITSLDAGQNRTVVPLSRIPLSLQHAVVAIEDERFYQHAGVDLKAILRAALADARGGGTLQGGSTIPEQLAKIAFTGDDRTITRKLKDAVLALRLERTYSRAAILQMYLNTVYLGQGAYGVQAAAQTYFSRPAWQLTLPESALIAGLIEAPSAYDPIFSPRAALGRRDQVLGRMLALGMIDAGVERAAAASPLGLRPNLGSGHYPAAYFVDYVKRWFLANPRFGATYADRYRMLFEGGLRIHTTIDLRLQAEAEQAVGSVLTYRSDPYGAMTVIQPSTGDIVAMVGGRDYFANAPFSKLNLATGGATGRQSGSAFKPFALVTALEDGISPQEVFPAPSSIDVPVPGGGPPWHVSNFDNANYGEMTLEQATIDSVNTVYAQLVTRIGASSLVATAHRMGITSPLQAVPSAVLGTNDVNTLEMASGYGTLAAEGRYTPPIAVTEVTDASGRVLYRVQPDPQQVVPAPIAYAVDLILEKVVDEGTGIAANIDRPAAGKTGTTENEDDAWFVGFTPQLAAAVWVGFPQGEIPMVAPRVRVPQVLGGTWPAEIWRAFMLNALKGVPPTGFAAPPTGYVSVAIDITRGCLPNAYTPPGDVRTVRFPAGTQPTEVCTEPTSPQPLAVPSVVGLARAEALRTLRQLGFAVRVTLEATAAVPPGTVLLQTPAAGVEARGGATVTITVATAPSPSSSPSFPPPG